MGEAPPIAVKPAEAIEENRFRPTYPGFAVEVSGVERRHAAFLKRKPHTWSSLTLRSRKSGQRWGELGHPYRVVEEAWENCPTEN
jgi:hypothetical protein